MKSLMISCWQYRHFIISSIRNELTSQFIRSKLGGLWMVINPLVMVCIYAFVLSAVLSAKFDGIDNEYAYAIYLTSGIIGWTLFSDIITRCLGLFISNGNLMKKMVMPKAALPIISTGTAMTNNALLIIASMGIFFFLGHNPGMNTLWLPAITGVMILLALGIGLISGVINVFVRDVGQLIPIVLQLMFWFTPIVYPASIIPAQFRDYLAFNPVYSLITSYHDVLAFNRTPDLVSLSLVAAASLVLIGIGLFMVRRANAEMVDVL